MLIRLAIFSLSLSILPLIQFVDGIKEIQPLGSILFVDHGFPKKCLVQSDIAQLATRFKFQDLLPKNIELVNDATLMAMVRYFYGINEIIERMNPGEARQLVLKCFYDMLGGYLKHILLPITKYSFYAGNTTFSVAQNIFNVYDRCKELLDTNGNSWNDPITDFSQFNVKVIPIVIPNVPDDEAMKACASLLINQNDDETEEDMLISLPKIETEDNNDLSLIRFPLKRKHSYSINSRKASFILVRYFVMVTQCFKYQGINQSLFNKKLNLWLNENVIPYLDDDQLYPAFGAVLRVIEAIKNPHDGTYQGAKKVYIKSRMSQMARKTSILGDALGSENNFYLNDGNRDFNWWLNVNLASTGIFIFFCLIIFMMVRICCNRKRIIETEYNTRINTTNNGTRKTKPMTSLKSKMSKIFRNSTHIPENDEFYEYKRVNSNDKKEIKFENEKFKGALSPTPSKKKKNVKVKLIEKFNLPLLNAESEEDEIVFQKTRDSTDRSSVSLNNELFKISEESGNESSGSKASKRHRKKQSKSPKGQNGKK